MAGTIIPIGVEFGVPYIFIGPDGTRAVLNDLNDPDFVGYTTGDDAVTGLERAGVRENADQLPGGDGGVHGIFHDDRLSWTIKGIVMPDGGASPVLQDKLMRATNARRADGILQWRPTTSDRDVRVRFREQQPTRITGRRPKQFFVAGVCEDPTVESALENVVSIVPDAASTLGLASPVRSPLSSVPSTPVGAIIRNVGRSRAWPRLFVFGPCAGITVRNATVGRELIIDYTLAAGEFLEIDTSPRHRRILLNGVANRYGAGDWARSSWWWLESGDNDVRIGLSSFSAGASVEVRYRDAWG